MRSIKLRAFRDEILTIYKTGRHARKTYLAMRKVLDLIGAVPGVVATKDLTTANLAAYVTSRTAAELSPATVNGELGYLRTASIYAVESGYLKALPSFRRVLLREGKTTLNVPISLDDATQLLVHLRDRSIDWKEHRLYALYAFLLMTGLRKGEALNGRIEDLDLKARTFEVIERDVRLKTQESARTVAMPPPLVRVLRDWLPRSKSPWIFPGVRRVGPWTGGPPGGRALDQIQAAATAIGLDHLTIHGLRHTYGTHAIAHFDQSLPVVQKGMGHTDPRTTARYIRLNAAPLVEASKRIDYRVSV